MFDGNQLGLEFSLWKTFNEETSVRLVVVQEGPSSLCLSGLLGRLSIASGNLITSYKLWTSFDSIVHDTRHYIFNVCRVCGDPTQSR